MEVCDSKILDLRNSKILGMHKMQRDGGLYNIMLPNMTAGELKGLKNGE
jgi:hypothetical protein